MRKKKLKIKDNLENKFFQRASLSLLMKEFFVVLSLLMKEFLLFCTSLDNKFIQRACGVFSCGGKGNTFVAGKFFRIQSKGMLQVFNQQFGPSLRASPYCSKGKQYFWGLCFLREVHPKMQGAIRRTLVDTEANLARQQQWREVTWYKRCLK